MWVQLIKLQLKPDADLIAASDLLKSFEQPGSGLIREIFTRDQKNPNTAYVIALFESEEKAREREADPRRAEGQQELQRLLADSLAAPPEFVDLDVAAVL